VTSGIGYRSFGVIFVEVSEVHIELQGAILLLGKGTGVPLALGQSDEPLSSISSRNLH